MTNSLLQTKLQPPRIHPELVPRPGLTRLFDDSDAVKLVLLSAPASSGKSSLLSHWLRTSRRAAAWLSLDEGDNDVAHFLAYLCAAIKTIQPEIGRGMEAMLQAAQLPAPQILLTYLINEAGEVDDNVILVLDDYHVITKAAIHEALQFLLDYLPPQLHLVIGTRIDPPVPLARLRTRGELLEIRVRDLRFDQDEATHLLNQTAQTPLTATEVATLNSEEEPNNVKSNHPGRRGRGR